MKFFIITKYSIFDNKVKYKKIQTYKYTNFLFSLPSNSDLEASRLPIFCNFLFKKGLKRKYKNFLGFAIFNFNNFVKNNFEFINANFNQIGFLLQEMFLKKHFFGLIFEFLLSLIESPLYVKSKTIPKNLKKKARIKQKYLLKIAYLDKSKRVKNSFRQLHNYSKMFDDSNFKIRLYKALLYTFLEHKESYIYKLKYSFLKNLKNLKVS